jgi:hypothetical protein
VGGGGNIRCVLRLMVDTTFRAGMADMAYLCRGNRHLTEVVESPVFFVRVVSVWGAILLARVHKKKQRLGNPNLCHHLG